MKTSTINHPALVALQGRLKTIAAESGQIAIKHHAERAIEDIDYWLTLTKDQHAPQAIDAEFWLALPPAKWQAALQATPADQVGEALRALDGHIETAARVRGYLAGLVQGKSHAKRVTASNHLATKIRRALGYSYAKQDLTF